MRSGRGAVATFAALAIITGLAACGEGGNTRPSPAQDRAAVRGALMTVSTIKVNGDRALAQVSSGAKNQKASNDVVELVRERGAWRVASLGGPQPPAPKKPGDES